MTLSDSLPYSFTDISVAAGATVCFIGLYFGAKHTLAVYNSPLRNLPCPDQTPHLVWGDILSIVTTHGDIVHQDWMHKLGSTFRIRGFLLAPTLLTKDPRAISHILTHAYDFPKPEMMRKAMGRLVGEGVLLAEGEDHRRQRQIMNPSFSPIQLRELLPVFYDKVEQLKDILLQEAERISDDTPIDVLVWLNRVTLDIIGCAGFDYNFNSLETGEENELIRSFLDVLDPKEPPSAFAMICSFIPLIRRVPNKFGRTIDHCRRTLVRIGTSLIAEKKRAVLAAQDGSEKTTFSGRDLLSVMIKANMATGIKDSARLTDKEVIDQISTILIAGHETSASSLSWLFYRLSKAEHQPIQSKLREEILSVASPRPSMEDLNALPYLDAVLREILRLNTVVDSTNRCSLKDAVIPLSEPFLDRDGILRNEIRIGKDEQIFIPVSAMNRDKRVWGDDAEEFKPERWLNPTSHPRSANSPGVFAGIMTFIGGTRACIGYKFAILEMKAIIFVLLRHMRFELPVVPLKIERHEVIVTRPVIKQPDGKMKNTMPLRVTVV